MEKPQISTLSNGMKVITQKTPTEQIYAEVTVNVGYRHEKPEETSVTHFLEHMAASDTTVRSKQEKDSAIKSMRGSTNASTSQERTNYFLRVGNEYTEDAVQILADGILRPLFDEKTVNVERKAVQQELIGKSTQAGRIAYEQLLQTAFPGTQIDKDIIGSTDLLETHDRDKLKNFMDLHYTGDNMVLTVVGNVDHDQICAMAEKHFEGLPAHPDRPRSAPPAATYRGGMKTRNSNEQEQISLYMGFEGSGRQDPQTTATDQVLAGILGSGFSSRLMKSLRSDKGLVYNAGSYNLDMADNGIFALTAATTAENLRPAMEAMCEEVVRFADTVTEEELDVMKNYLRGTVERQIESPSTIGAQLGVNMAVDQKLYDYKEEVSCLANVTLEQVQERARQIFSTAPTVTAYGKGAVENMPSYEEITAKLGHQRELDASGLVKENLPDVKRGAAQANVAGKPAEQQREVA